MTKVRKIILAILFFTILILINNKVEATTINVNPSNPKVGDTVTITVTVPNVHTATVTANVSGVVSGTIKVVGGDLAGNPSTYSNSAKFTCTKEGNIIVSISGDSRAILNGQDVNVGASTSVKVSAKETSSGNNGSNSSSGTSNTNSTNNQTTEKSNNANLTNLGIRPNDFSGFKANTLEYKTTVPNDVEKIEVYASGVKGQKITGTGNKTLTVGENKFEVVVTAEDGKTTKKYTITVTREGTAEEQPLENPDVFGLSGLNLKTEGITLEPEFRTDIYEYTINLTEDIDKIDLEGIVTEENAKVEIMGNENLKEGENIITILVTNESGEKTATYQITVNKSLEDKEALAKEKELEKQNRTKKLIIIGSGAAISVIILIVVIIIIRRNNKARAEEYQIPYYNYNKEDDDDFEYVKGKAKRSKTEEIEEQPNIQILQQPKLEKREEVKQEEDHPKEEKKEFHDIREEFLKQQENDQIEYEEEEISKPKGKHKGKRFK